MMNISNQMWWQTIFIMCLLVANVYCQSSVQSEAPGTYEILKKNTSVITIPFSMHRGKPVIELQINGKKAKLMIDNGIIWDQVWLFGSPLVSELQLEPINKGDLYGSGEGSSTTFYESTNLKLKFDDIIFYEQPVLVSPPSAGFTKMFHGTDGQLSGTFFKHFIVEFDFIKKQIKLHKPEIYAYRGNGSELDIVLTKSGTHAVPFKFEMQDGTVYNDRVDIDFGGIYALKIALNNRHKIEMPTDVTELSSYGAQGKSFEYRSTIKSMTIGKFTFDQPMVVFGNEKTSRIHPENLGVIGLPMFMKFHTTFDYINKKLYIDSNENYDKP